MFIKRKVMKERKILLLVLSMFFSFNQNTILWNVYSMEKY